MLFHDKSLWNKQKKNNKRGESTDQMKQTEHSNMKRSEQDIVSTDFLVNIWKTVWVGAQQSIKEQTNTWHSWDNWNQRKWVYSSWETIW